MTTATAILLTIIAILLSGLFSGVEIAYVQSNKVRMEIDATRGGFIDKIIRRFSRHEEMFISTLLVGNNVVLVVYGITFSFLVNGWLEHLFHNEALVLITNTILSSGLILITGEFLPKTSFRINPNLMLRLFALPVYLIYMLLYPVTKFIEGISHILMKWFGITSDKPIASALTMEELDDYLQQSIDETPDKAAVENEVKIFRNAVDFKDTQIGECMIPRNEIVAVEQGKVSREQLIRKFIATGLSKIVVFKDDINDIIGYIHVSELFDPDSDWTTRLKPVIFTPETMLANKMMRRMMAEKKSLAIVIDEFGGTAGLVTLEDLVEEIFGEIEDEHDRHKVIARKTAENTWEFGGRAEIERINEEFGLDLEEDEDYHTIAGWILNETEALPHQGDKITIGDYEVEVLRMSAARIELVRLTHIA